MSQASSNAPSLAAEADDAQQTRTGSWWKTLPGMLTGAAALISAITRLVVAVQQPQPTSHASPPTTPANTQAADTTPATAGTTHSGADSTPAPPVAVQVSFPARSHVQLGDLRYDVLSATATAGNPGELALALRVKLTNGGRFDANLWAATLRLRVGSDVNAPTNLLNDLVHGGTTGIAAVDFTLPASTRQATLLVGDDPTSAIALPLSLHRSKR